MKKGKIFQRLLAFSLVVCLILGMTGSASAEKNTGKGTGKEDRLQEVSPDSGKLQWTLVDDEAAGVEARQVSASGENGLTPAGGNDSSFVGEVRVFIVLEEESALEEGIPVQGFSENERARSFAEEAEKQQELVLADIQRAVRYQPLEVRYQFSVIANAVSAEVDYGDIEAIKEVEGVKSVYVVPKYYLQETAVPNTITAGEMVGSYETWDSGYTGAGQRIAIVDNGIDMQHPSFAPEAFAYGRKKTEEKTGHKVAEDELLSVKDISKVFGQLKIGSKGNGISPRTLYWNEKIAFGFNYVGRDLNIFHENGDHGTHVAGIAAANQYVPAENGGYQEQPDGVAGIAKDAQLLVMKVFGESNESYADDYMAAVEDALMLDADVVNLSIGAPSPGESTAFNGEEYVDEIFARLTESDLVVSISAGNNGAWADSSTMSHNRAADVNMNMVGVPGSYTNAFTVASAVNAGYRDHGFRVGKQTYFYRDAEGNADVPPMTSLVEKGKEADYPYVFLESFGEAGDYASIDVKEKIVFVSRGIISYAEKHENAQQAGAAGLFIYCDDNMYPKLNLSDSKAEIPCAIMGWEDSWSLQEKGKTGMVGILSEPVNNVKVTDGYRMSGFSAWGVPGDLSLKPEITAPGENIYATLGGGSYGCMSGTSMAAPGIAGMSALLSEYIKRKGLEEKTGIGRRALTQSLLMSTAIPLKEKDKEEYSPRKQGSGLANVYAAATTPACLFVGDEKGNDGKVKAELGDDPERKGVYEFSFRVLNLTEENQYYTLDSAILTEDLLDGKWIAGSSHKLQPEVTFSSKDQVLVYDLNGDGTVDKEDAKELLRHVNESICLKRVTCNQEKFDFIEDGVIDTADVYGFLEELKAPTVDFQERTLEVEDTAQVSVKVALSRADKKYLDSHFTNGMYVDGFVYLKGVVELSIPMLAFYGNWTESSMFEPFDYLEAANGGQEQMTYSGAESANYLNYYRKEEDRTFCYSSNIYLKGGDKKYLPDRNAFSTNSGDRIDSISYSLIRNAAIVETSIVNDKTGEVYYRYKEEDCGGTYYNSEEGNWCNSEYISVLDWQGRDKHGKPLPEGTRVRVAVTALPEYYRDRPKEAADGATFSVPITIDNTNPKLITMYDEKPGEIRLRFEDNRYTAAVKVYDRDRETLLSSYGVNQEKPGVPMQITIQDPKKVFYLKLVDYAGNTVSYRVNRSGSADTPYTDGVTLSETELRLIKNNTKRLKATVEPEGILDDTVIWSSEDKTIATVDGKGNVTGVMPGTTRIVATTKAKNKAGESETAVCQVVVEEIAVSLNGIVWNEDGKSWFVNFNTAKLPKYTKLAQIKKHYYAAAAKVKDKILAVSGEPEGSGLYLIDPANQYQTVSQGEVDWEISDLAYSPGSDMVFTVNGTVLNCFERGDINGMNGYMDVGNVTQGDKLVGITYAGSSNESGYGSVDWFYLVSQGGRLYEMGYSGKIDEYFYEDILKELGESGISTGEESTFSSLYYDPDSGHIFWSVCVGGEVVKLYALSCQKDRLVNTFFLGSFPAGEWPVVGLFGTSGKDGYSFEAERRKGNE